MERRVSSLETKVAVLGTRQDTADAELSNVRADIREIREELKGQAAKIHYGQGALGLLMIALQVVFGA